MSLIEGIGDEVVEFFIGLIIIIIGKYDILLLYFLYNISSDCCIINNSGVYMFYFCI